MLHANFVEAILDGRLVSRMGEITLIILEVMLALGGAILFALKLHDGLKWGLVGAVSILILLGSYLLLQNLGVFFEFLLPLLFVGGHALAHQIIEWHASHA